MQDYSYGDSSGFAPDSLLMCVHDLWIYNQMRCKPTVMVGIKQMIPVNGLSNKFAYCGLY